MKSDTQNDHGPTPASDDPSTVLWCDSLDASEYKVFVKYENEDGGLERLIGREEAVELLACGPLIVCTVIGLPAHVAPHRDIINAAHFAEAADPGQVAQFFTENQQHRRLCVGGSVAFQVGRYACPNFWKRGEVVKLPLVTGISQPLESRSEPPDTTRKAAGS